jgi:O-acetyl-ADP-ribose deacetylase (regulator of RNase III)
MAPKKPFLDTKHDVEEFFLKLLEWVHQVLESEEPLPDGQEFKWIKPEQEWLWLEVSTSLEALSQLLVSPRFSGLTLEQKKNKVRYYIRYLKELGIWKDKKQGQSNNQGQTRKRFILKLWSKDKLENQEQFKSQWWSSYNPKNSLEAEASSELTGIQKPLSDDHQTNIGSDTASRQRQRRFQEPSEMSERQIDVIRGDITDIDTASRQRQRRFQEPSEVSEWRIDVIMGDITQQPVDAIVNPTDHDFSASGGVDKAIHTRAGLELRQACRQLGTIFPGEAKITPGYNLRARFIIHTVGPYWQGGRRGESEVLAKCYQNSLALAEQSAIQTLAFPAISTGDFGFPIEMASTIAVGEVNRFLKTNTSVEKVIFVCFGEHNYQYYLDAINRIYD